MSQAERVANIATDRLHLIRVIPTKGKDAASVRIDDRQMFDLAVFFIFPIGDSDRCPMN